MSLRNLRVYQVGSHLRSRDLIQPFVSRGRDKIDDHALQSLLDKSMKIWGT